VNWKLAHAPDRLAASHAASSAALSMVTLVAQRHAVAGSG
jgi:hypothetical protein